MKALVFSDSHGDERYLKKALALHPDYEAIFHLGDIQGGERWLRDVTPYPVYIVRGNCDYSTTLEDRLTVTFGGHKIAMCHGHRYMMSSGWEDLLRYYGREEGADIVMFGHPHVPYLEQRYDGEIMNPGRISSPRQANKIPTYTVMETLAGGEVSFRMCEIQ